MSRVRIWCRGKLPKSSDLAGLGLLIVSPLINMMDGKKDMNREQDARAFLATWQAQRKEGGCTTIGTAHLNKKNDLNVVQRILGASGIANFVRSNWSIQRDNDDQGLRLFMRLKANLSPDTVNGIKFTIRHVGPYQQSICCAWAGTTDKTPDEVMGNGRGAKPSADRWLVEFLKQHGETKRHEIMAAAAQAGHSQSAVQKAKARNSKILDFQIGIPGKAYWRLDGNDQEH